MNKAEFARRALSCERKLYRVARTLLYSDADCEDAVQEALLRAWSRIGSLREEAYFETWLVRILMNECRNIYRRKPKNQVELSNQLPDAVFGNSFVFEALQGLPRKLRIVLELHYIEGYKTRELAQMLRVPESTVKWRLVEGRKRLKAELAEEVLI